LNIDRPKESLKDLQICTFQDCITADRIFESKHDWFAHEIRAHRQWWRCFFGCENTFQSSDGLREHFQVIHTNSIDVLRLDEIIKACERQPDMQQKADCVLCGAKMASLKVLRTHMGRHMEDLALFALPSNTEYDSDTDDDLIITEDEDKSNSQDE
jgi:hypothetical protein